MHAIEHQAQQDADDRQHAREQDEEAALLADVRESMLEALLSGDDMAPVMTADRRTDALIEEPVSLVVSVLWDEKLSGMVAKLLALDTPEAKVAREYIADQHVRSCEGVLQ